MSGSVRNKAEGAPRPKAEAPPKAKPRTYDDFQFETVPLESMRSAVSSRPSTVPRTPVPDRRGRDDASALSSTASLFHAGTLGSAGIKPTIPRPHYVAPHSTAMCAKCTQAPAVVRCGNCRAFYCQDCCDHVHVGSRAEAKHLRFKKHVIRPVESTVCHRCQGTTAATCRAAQMFCWDCDVILCEGCDLTLHKQVRLSDHQRCSIVIRPRPLEATNDGRCLSPNKVIDVIYRKPMANVY
ncbi:hypothetical protein M885DRAFT_619702 [Pelagophyceae sp. CCMP2097]|nr:hypothetical protein M885DRAFT_619702 [Pelagophyceae sp. CCMP2097]